MEYDVLKTLWGFSFLLTLVFYLYGKIYRYKQLEEERFILSMQGESQKGVLFELHKKMHFWQTVPSIVMIAVGLGGLFFT